MRATGRVQGASLGQQQGRDRKLLKENGNLETRVRETRAEVETLLAVPGRRHVDCAVASWAQRRTSIVDGWGPVD